MIKVPSVIRGCVQESWSRLSLRVALRNVDRQTPIIVYQMGKVGSSTVVSTLENLNLPNPVLHVHTLVADRLIAAKERQRASSRPFLDDHLIASSILVSRLSKDRFPCRIITLTREPISRAISFAFEDWHKKLPSAHRGNGNLDSAAMKAAVEVLLSNGGHHADPSQWFDDEVKSVFGLDVFAQPYDDQRGYATIRADDVSLLILRMEDLNRSLPGALADFLGLDAGKIAMSRANESDSKWYSDCSNEVRQKFRLPKARLDSILSSRYIRHFYANDVDRLRARWEE